MNHLANTGPPGGFGHPNGAHDIDGGVELRIRYRTPDIDLGGQVVDNLGLGFGKQPDQVGADDIGLDEFERSMGAGAVEIGHPTGTKIVDAGDGVSVGE